MRNFRVNCVKTVLHRFLLAHGASAFSSGVHIILLSWLSVSLLDLSPAQLGWVQAAGLIPNLFLMLFTGAWADRYNPALLLAGGLSLHTVCFISLASLIHADALSFYSLLVYAVLVGVGNAFCQPVREKLVTDIEKHTVQKRVSLLSVTQFTLQSAGILLAGTSDTIGLFEVVCIQALVATFSVVMTLTLTQHHVGEPSAQSNTFEDIVEGVKLLRSNKALRQLMVLVGFNGFMHMGVFIVVLPIIATDVYSFSAAQYSGLQLLFVVGMIVAHFRLFTLDTVEFPGHGALFSLLYTALIGFALAKYPTEWGLYVLILAWGAVAGNSAGRSRLVLLAVVEQELKGRAISIYQLLLFGAAPFGALLTGYCLHYVGVRDILEIMSISSAALFVVFLLSRSLWAVKQEEPQN